MVLSSVLSLGSATATYTYKLRNASARVKPGQRIQTGDLLAISSVTHPVTVIDLSPALGRNGKSPSFSKGDAVNEGETLAETSGRFGLGRRSITAPSSGEVESFNAQTGILLVRPRAAEEKIVAGFPAKVAVCEPDRIQVEVAGLIMRSMMAKGRPVWGDLAVIDDTESTSDALRAAIGTGDFTPPQVIAFQRPLDASLARLVRDAYWKPDDVALVGPSASYSDFMAQPDPFSSLTILGIDGYGQTSFGPVDSDPIWRTLTEWQGKKVLVLSEEGCPQPCIVLADAVPARVTNVQPQDLHPGIAVRFMRGFDIAHGTVVEAPRGSSWLPSGYLTPAARVALADGTVELVAQDNIEVLSNGATG